MRWAITHRPQDLPRSKHILAEGKTLEEDTTFIGRQFYRSNTKPESCEGTIVVCLACRIHGLSELGSLTREILQCLRGWPSVRMRDSLNHIQGNDLGAGWIDHHTDLLLLFALLYGMVNLSDLPMVEWRQPKPGLNLRMVWQFSLVQGSRCQS